MKKAESIAMCGSKICVPFNAENGIMAKTWVTHQCKNWRECDRCLMDRAVLHAAEAKQALDEHNGELWMAYIPRGESAKFVRHTGADHYFRYPHENHDIFIFDGDTNYDLSEIHVITLQADDFEVDSKSSMFVDLVYTRPRSNVSGNLYSTSREKEHGEEDILASLPHHIIEDAENHTQEIAEAQAEAVARSANWQPTEQTVQRAIDQRDAFFQEALMRRGVRVLATTNIRRYVDPEKIDWIDFTDPRYKSSYSLIYKYISTGKYEIEPEPGLSFLQKMAPEFA